MGGVRARWIGGLVLAALAALAAGAEPPKAADWPVTEGAPGGGRYSPLADITPENVASLRVAWTYHHGDSWRATFPPVPQRSSAFESTPIVVDGRLFFTTPRNRVIALDPETGRELWTFDPKVARGIYANMWINRGVAYWRDPDATGACSARVFLATLDARLIALDAATGQPCADFGARGTVNLLDGIAPVYDAREYNVTSPGTVLVTLAIDGKPRDAVAQATKHGFVFILDRETGAPLFPVEERPAPASDVPGERAWPTQPVPSAPPPLVPQRLTEADLYAPSPEHLAACRKRLDRKSVV